MSGIHDSNWGDWSSDRWHGITRPYTMESVQKLRPSIPIKYSLAQHGAEKLWSGLKTSKEHFAALGAVTGAQAVSMVRAGLKTIYVSGWQVAADANQASNTYPDQSLYPCNSVPTLIKRIQNALMRADQVEKLEQLPTGERLIDWFVPILADAEAGFGGPVHAFDLMKQMIEAGASAVHFEDQLASEKKCGHLGGKVLVPTSQFIRTLTAARLAADVCNVPTIIVARTDALGAKLLTSDIDEIDHEFVTGDRTPEGYFRVRPGLASAISRGLSYAPYADLIWFETSQPNVKEAQAFAEAIHKKYPNKLLAYNCSPSFNWSSHLDAASIASFQKDLNQLGYKYQFITLAGWHSLNYHSFDLAERYKEFGMTSYVELQEQEFAAESRGYTATRHQREVGTGYFDQILNTVSGGSASTSALHESTEEEQFQQTHKSGQRKPTFSEPLST